MTGEQVTPTGTLMGPRTMPKRPSKALMTGLVDDPTLSQHSSEPVVHWFELCGAGVATARSPKEARTASVLNCMLVMC